MYQSKGFYKKDFFHQKISNFILSVPQKIGLLQSLEHQPVSKERTVWLHKRPVQMLLLCPIMSRSWVHTVSSGRAGAPLTQTAIIWLYPVLHMGSLPFADGLNPLSERERERLSFSLRPADQSVTSLPGCIKDHMVVLQLSRSKEKYAQKQLWSLTCSNPVYQT